VEPFNHNMSYLLLLAIATRVSVIIFYLELFRSIGKPLRKKNVLATSESGHFSARWVLQLGQDYWERKLCSCEASNTYYHTVKGKTSNIVWIL
jgi:hypothetical protein